MKPNRDFRDRFAAFDAAGVRYLLVGGYALAVYAEPRATKDLDIWIEPTRANAKRVYEALQELGAPLDRIDVSTFASPGLIFQIGVAPNRIDVLTEIDGVSFKSAWPARVEAEYGGEPVHVIGRRHLIKNKLASGRPQDLVDAQNLRRSR
jgi:hypothetical protein